MPRSNNQDVELMLFMHENLRLWPQVIELARKTDTTRYSAENTSKIQHQDGQLRGKRE